MSNNDKALRYNEGKKQWTMIDWESMEGLVDILEFGAKKYSTYRTLDDGSKELLISGRDNWKKGLELSSILDSAQRHLIAMMKGEFTDPESGFLHAHHVMCNMMFWVHFYNKQSKKISDMPKAESKSVFI